MLDHLKLTDGATRVRSAIREVIGAGKFLTPDLGGSGSTTEYTDELLRQL